MEQGTFIEAGKIVRFIRNGRTYNVRVDACKQTKATYGEREHLAFSGYRVRPGNLKVSFGVWHSYLVRTTEIIVLAIPESGTGAGSRAERGR